MEPWDYLMIEINTIKNGPLICASKFTPTDLNAYPIREYLQNIKYELVDEDNSIYYHSRQIVYNHNYKMEYNTYSPKRIDNNHYYLIRICSKDSDTYLTTHYNQLLNSHLRAAKIFKISDLDTISVKKFLKGLNYELIDANIIPYRFYRYVDKDYRIWYNGSLWHLDK